MEKWEYRHIVANRRGFVNLAMDPEEFRCKYMVAGISTTTTDEDEDIRSGRIIHYEDMLNILGQEGWELVCHNEEEHHSAFFFKRQTDGAAT